MRLFYMAQKQTYIFLYMPIKTIAYMVEHTWDHVKRIMTLTNTMIHYNIIDRTPYFLIRGFHEENVLRANDLIQKVCE